MTDGSPPPEVQAAARQRAAARAARDWTTADRLRADIEGAGWQVVDSGVEFRLEPAHPADLVDGVAIRYGSSDSVPGRLDEPSIGLATLIVVASAAAGDVLRAVEGLRGSMPGGTSVILVADAPPARALLDLERALGDWAASEAAAAGGIELIRTSGRLGLGAAINIGIRRATGSVVLILDPSLEPVGDIVTPLARALDDPSVAIAGPVGLATSDLRHFEEIAISGGEDAGPGARDATAIAGSLAAFRRADAVARGPLDERFGILPSLDVWWSLVLRDEGEEQAPRRAVVVADLPIRRHDATGWAATPSRERDRLARRNFYRMLDRFGRREDLIVP